MDEDDLLFVDAVLFDDEHVDSTPPAVQQDPRRLPQPNLTAVTTPGGPPEKHLTARPPSPLLPPTSKGVSSTEGGDDPIGSLVARALNTGEISNFGRCGIEAAAAAAVSRRSNAEGDSGDGRVRRKFRPLLCADNVRFAWSVVRWMSVTTARRGPRYVVLELTERFRTLVPSDRRAGGVARRPRTPTTWETLVSSAALLSVSVLLLAAPGYACTVSALRFAVLCVLALLTALIDPTEVADLFPSLVWALQFVLGASWNWMDGRILLGNQHLGRDWGADAESDVGSGQESERRKGQSLIKRWRGRFGKRLAARKGNWDDVTREALFSLLEKDRLQDSRDLKISQKTAEHLVAMNFCYTMLRGAKKDEGKPGEMKRKKRGKSHRALVNTVSSHKRSTGGPKPVKKSISLGLDDTRGKEGVDAVQDREKMPPDRYDRGDLILTASSLDHSDDEGFETIEIINSNSDEAGKRPRKFISTDERVCDTHGLGSRRRLNSDSKVNYQSKDEDDDSTVEPLGIRRPLSSFGVSFDDLDLSTGSSMLTSSSLAESRDKQSMHSSLTSASLTDQKGLNWLDVGAKIGIRLLNSEKVQNAINNPVEAENFLSGLGPKVKGSKKAVGDSPSNRPKRPLPNLMGPSNHSERHLLQSKRNCVSPPRHPICIDNQDFFEPISPLGMGEGEVGGTLQNKAKASPDPEAHVPRPVHAIWTSAGAAVSPECHESPTVGSSILSAGTGRGIVANLDLFKSDDVKIPVLRKGSGKKTQSSEDSPLPEPHGNSRADSVTGSSHTQPFDSRRLLPPSMSLRSLTVTSPRDRPRPPPLDVSAPPNRKGWKNQSHSPLRRSLRPVDCASPSNRAQRWCVGNSPRTSRSPSSRAAKGSSVGVISPFREPMRRRVIAPGVKMVVPLCPIIPPPIGGYHHYYHHNSSGHHSGRKHRRIAHLSGSCHYQIATVVSSKRIYVPSSNYVSRATPTSISESLSLQQTKSMEEQEILLQQRSNCLSVTVLLDKSFLRDGKFAEMTIRVMDDWTGRHVMPRHSKFPIGSCVATSFGVGVLVGWRVEDDCHVIRSLWRRRGGGSALAYLNRDALHGVVNAVVGFEVETRHGRAKVDGYVNAGADFRLGTYFIRIEEPGPQMDHLVQCDSSDILSCRAAKFIPVIEQIKESAKFQIQMEAYELLLLERSLEGGGLGVGDATMWHKWSEGFELILSSFIRAVEEDVDQQVNQWLASFISFLESLDFNGNLSEKKNSLNVPESPLKPKDRARTNGKLSEPTHAKPGKAKETRTTEETAIAWLDEIFGGLFKPDRGEEDCMSDISSVTTDMSVRSVSKVELESQPRDSYGTAYSFLRLVLRTLAIARASVPGRPNVQMALTMTHELILFIRTVIKVQQKNMSTKSVKAWKRTFDDIVATFGPLKRRLEKLGNGIAERLKEHGKIAKHRGLQFVDILMSDDSFLQSLELGAWNQCLARLEVAVVRAGILDRETTLQYHKTAEFICSTLAPAAYSNQDAAVRNGEKFAQLALALKCLASPQRSFLAFFLRDEVLEVIERLMVRVYEKDSDACNMLNICAFNFNTFRHLRIFNNVAISGKLWRPILDAADEEFAWAVSCMPENAREYVEPISKLFSLGVAKFHQVRANDLTSDWLDFLMEEEAVKIIQQLDLKLILNVESFCNDLKEASKAAPYYSSIDDDILNLIDEVDLDKVLKEAANALVDAEKFSNYIREKSAVAVKRFLDYLPKISIPVEKRELGEGWVLTCREKFGGDLRLSDVSFEQEFMVCNVIGSGNIFSPVDLLGDGLLSLKTSLSPSMSSDTYDLEDIDIEVSVLNEIADLIKNAQHHGSWQPGIGGVEASANGKTVDPAFEGLPVSEVLKCGVELWKNLEIDDEELMEIAIRDVSYQIQLQKEREEGTECVLDGEKWSTGEQTNPAKNAVTRSGDKVPIRQQKSAINTDTRKKFRFNPRKDPTVLFLELNKVTCHLDDFLFRVEQKESSSTIFDPVFQGYGSLAIKNLSIKLRVECRKERVIKHGAEVLTPVLQLQELEIKLEKVKVKFKDTGADWLLNKIMKGFRDNITEVVEVNVKEQIEKQIQIALENLNSYIGVNPDLVLTVLGITIDDLEENVIWV